MSDRCPICGEDGHDSLDPTRSVCPTDDCPIDTWDPSAEPSDPLPFEPRVRALLAVVATAAVIVGWWIGIMSVPEAALATPEGVTPVPSNAFGGMFLVATLGGLVAWQQWQLADDREERRAEP